MTDYKQTNFVYGNLALDVMSQNPYDQRGLEVVAHQKRQSDRIVRTGSWTLYDMYGQQGIRAYFGAMFRFVSEAMSLKEFLNA